MRTVSAAGRKKYEMDMTDGPLLPYSLHNPTCLVPHLYQCYSFLRWLYLLYTCLQILLRLLLLKRYLLLLLQQHLLLI